MQKEQAVKGKGQKMEPKKLKPTNTQKILTKCLHSEQVKVEQKRSTTQGEQKFDSKFILPL